MKLAILDINHTVNQPFDGTFVQTPYEQKIIPGAITGMKFLQDNGWTLIGASNQKGFPTYKPYENILVEMRHCQEMLYDEGISMYGILIALGKGETCSLVRGFGAGAGLLDCYEVFSESHISYRKPSPGMINLARQLTGYPQDVIMIGDRPEDRDAAKNAMIPYIEASTWHQNPTHIPSLIEC